MVLGLAATTGVMSMSGVVGILKEKVGVREEGVFIAVREKESVVVSEEESVVLSEEESVVVSKEESVVVSEEVSGAVSEEEVSGNVGEEEAAVDASIAGETTCIPAPTQI